MHDLPDCRWRERPTDGALRCRSPKFIAPPNRVDADFCRQCRYANHPSDLPRIFCITCKQTPERTEVARRHFAEILPGREVEFFPGIHGKTFGLLTARTHGTDFVLPSQWRMSPGHVGLVLSHYMLWQTLTFLDFEEVLVLEDDAIFDADFPYRFARAYRELPADWQMVYVGSIWSDSMPRERLSEHVAVMRYPLGTHAYLLRRSALPILLATNHEARVHIDVQLAENTLPHLKCYTFLPSLVGQRTVSGGWTSSTDGHDEWDAWGGGPRMPAAKRANGRAVRHLMREFFAKLPRYAVAGDRGVISAADDSYFTGFQLLASSLAGKVKMALFDLGLSEANKDWCNARDIPVLALPEAIVDRNVHNWQLWHKPLCIQNSPFASTLWIDSDCIVVGDVNPLFDSLDQQPLVISHPAGANYPGPNAPALYDLFPVPSRLQAHETINNGVVGFTRAAKHRQLLDKWTWFVRQVGDKEHIRKLIGWADEGALIWAIQAANMNHVIRFDRHGWNRFHQSTMATPEEFAANFSWHPDDTILHFAHRPKFWQSWPALDLSDDRPPNYRFTDWNFTFTQEQSFQYPWWIDRRHVYFLYRLACLGLFGNVLEIGCHNGASTSAFLQALNDGEKFELTLCDIKVSPVLREAIARCRGMVTMLAQDSVSVIQPGFDLVMLDGDHRIGQVSRELGLFLFHQLPTIVAHDTNAKHVSGCEGAVFLGEALRRNSEFHVLEDQARRDGEFTERGLLFATRSQGVFNTVRPIWEEVMAMDRNRFA